MWCSGWYPMNLVLWYFKMMLKIKRGCKFFARFTQNMIVIIEKQSIYHVSKTRQLLKDLIQIKGDSNIYKVTKFTIFSRYLSYNFHMTKFFIQILRWKPFSSPLDLAGPSQSQGIKVNSFHHCAVLTASDKHLKILLGCDSFLLIVNYDSFQKYRKHKCFSHLFQDFFSRF